CRIRSRKFITTSPLEQKQNIESKGLFDGTVLGDVIESLVGRNEVGIKVNFENLSRVTQRNEGSSFILAVVDLFSEVVIIGRKKYSMSIGV
ncbi:hypothetical protein HAX54_009360, partial [Datura stramonium]|nr:hypothetical protein [Datura stramonium]